LVALIQFVYAEKEGPEPEFTFVRYEQSSKCMTVKDSSVSYVSGVLRLPA
jgi:predicted class III extradiol MEMO1 family dioxygenase